MLDSNQHALPRMYPAMHQSVPFSTPGSSMGDQWLEMLTVADRRTSAHERLGQRHLACMMQPSKPQSVVLP